MTGLMEEADDAINRVLEILQNRVDQFGVSEPTIQKQGKHRIVVELAGIQDSDRARALLQSTALLEFYLVKNVGATNEMLAQLDDILRGTTDEEELVVLTQSEKTKNISEPEIPETPEEKDDDGIKTVSELFGETDSDPADTSNTASDLSLIHI